jgi:hypothetical protein
MNTARLTSVSFSSWSFQMALSQVVDRVVEVESVDEGHQAHDMCLKKKEKRPTDPKAHGPPQGRTLW